MDWKLPDHAFGPEWAALELLGRGVVSDHERDALAALLTSSDLRWGELLEQALRHQMLSLVAFHLTESESDGAVPGYVRDLLATVLKVNRRRIEIYRAAAAEITETLTAEGVDFVATKGITFESTIYGGRGTRRMKDVDFMIAPVHRDAVAAVLERLGYAITFDWAPNPRREQISLRLNPDHLPKSARRTGDPLIETVHVDVANSLTWHKSLYEVPVEIALANRIEQPIPGIDDVRLPCFDADFQFIFTVLHLFREAWLNKFVEFQRDVSLMKFGDVIRLFRRDREVLTAAAFRETLERFNIVEPIAWVVEHLDRAFQTDLAPALGLDGRIEETRLAGAQPSRGEDRRWRGTMRERLAAKDRKTLFAETAG